MICVGSIIFWQTIPVYSTNSKKPLFQLYLNDRPLVFNRVGSTSMSAESVDLHDICVRVQSRKCTKTRSLQIRVIPQRVSSPNLPNPSAVHAEWKGELNDEHSRLTSEALVRVKGPATIR